MFKRILTSMLSVALVCMLFSANALAEDVYVTKYGKKYHKKDSRFIKGKDVTKLDREEAEELGYKPSSDFQDDQQKDELKAEK